MIKSPVAKAYRRFAESMPNDLKALAALIDADRSPFDPAKLAAVQMPVLIVVDQTTTRLEIRSRWQR